MRKSAFFPIAILALVQFTLVIALSSSSLAQEWAVRGKPQGTLKVVDLGIGHASSINLYSSSLIGLDKDSNWVPRLAEDWRWLNERALEFKLRRSVTFQNGEAFNADAVRINWEAYRSLENPKHIKFIEIPDETELQIIDDYTVRFSFPKPEGLALVKLWYFPLFAPTFFRGHKFEEYNW